MVRDRGWRRNQNKKIRFEKPKVKKYCHCILCDPENEPRRVARGEDEYLAMLEDLDDVGSDQTDPDEDWHWWDYIKENLYDDMSE